MSLRINLNLYPKEGFFFKESDNAKIRAASWKAVVKKVREYRERAKLPIGDPEAEVMQQACQRNPTLCHPTGPRITVNPPVSLKSRVLQWLSNFRRQKEGGAHLAQVSAEEAAGRARICASCPMNRPIGVNSCSSCKLAVGELRKYLFGDAKFDGRLGGCEILGADIASAVRFDEVRVDNPSLPVHCWRKITL